MSLRHAIVTFLRFTYVSHAAYWSRNADKWMYSAVDALLHALGCRYDISKRIGVCVPCRHWRGGLSAFSVPFVGLGNL